MVFTVLQHRLLTYSSTMSISEQNAKAGLKGADVPHYCYCFIFVLSQSSHQILYRISFFWKC